MMHASDQHTSIYLASQSPRRQALLSQVGISYTVLGETPETALSVCETPLPNEHPSDYVIRVAKAKALAGYSQMKQLQLSVRPILSADTAVVLEQKIYGKPKCEKEAFTTLSHLSGKTHQVMTAVTLMYQDRVKTILQISEVTFTALTVDDIDRYCRTTEPYDKAGAYAIQGYAARFIKHISGSYSGIMGLPLFETMQLLAEVNNQ